MAHSVTRSCRSLLQANPVMDFKDLKPVASGSEPRPVRLVDEIVRYGDLAYNPELPQEDRDPYVKRFNDLLSGSKALALLPALSALIQPGRAQPWLRSHITHALALLPLRPQGVRHTIEFILSVHPSTAQKGDPEESQTAQSRGPNISLEALNSASRLISSPPSDMAPDAWFSGIAPQLLSLLDGAGGLEMVKVSAYIIGYGILGRKALGAPGTPGWKNFAEPIISSIDPTLRGGPHEDEKETDLIISNLPLIRARNIIVTASKLAEALRKLASLLSSHPNPGLSKRLLEPLLLPLWSLSSWKLSNSPEFEEPWRDPARFLLLILLKLSSDSTHLTTIALNILYQGNRNESKLCWTYEMAPEGGIEIVKLADQNDRSLDFDERILTLLDEKVDAFVELVKPLREDDNVPTLFLLLCRKWLLTNNKAIETDIIIPGFDVKENNSLESKLIEGKVMQKLMDSLPDRLVSNSIQIIELALGVLNQASHSPEDVDRNDTVAIALSLINMVFSTQSSSRLLTNYEMSQSIRSALRKIAKRNGSEASVTARNLLLLLDFKAADSELPMDTSTISDKDLQDRRTYSLALSYLTAVDSPPPVRAQGIDLISGLIVAGSPALDIPATLILLMSILQDDEEYIYLRTIKTLILLSIKHPRAVMLALLERYNDANEDTSLDSRLRLGEALLQVIEKAGQTFTGDLARQVGEGLLAIAGRRGYRPKHEAEQRKKAEVKMRKNQEAEEAWEGPAPQLGPDVDPVLAQIVEGWEGKLGEEDVRIRASALSIFGSAIETNVAGLGSSTIGAAIDLSIHILTLELEYEKAILRRAAALLVMSLVRAFDKAQEEGTKLGFGFAGQSLDDVLRILGYVAETDNDGLVRQHAKDVMVGLGTWQVKGLVAPQEISTVELGALAGLSVDPNAERVQAQRPLIREVE